MKATTLIALAIYSPALLLGCREDTTDNVETLSIVGTNDVHGAIVEQDGAGGIALFGGYLANLRAARKSDGGAVLLIDAGDMWQGTLESNVPEGAPIVAAYNALGYAAAAIGNHEFDFGPVGPEVMARSDADDPRGALKARAVAADFPFLAANLIDEASDAPVNWPNVRPSHNVEVAGITVGIIGVTSDNTLQSTLSANVVGLRIAALAGTIRTEAEKLKVSGADLIVVAAHAGGDCVEFDNPRDLTSCKPDTEIFRVARELPAGLVDLIIGGHMHKGMAHEINGIAIVSSWSSGRFFGRVDFGIAGGKIVERRILPPTRICRAVDPDSGECRAHGNGVDVVYEGGVVIPDAAIAKLLEPAVTAAAAIKAEKLGPVLEEPIRRRPVPESPLGNLVTDILLASAPQASVAIHNTLGGIRADLPAGDLTYGAVYEMFPFDNRVVHLTLSGAELKAVLANQIEGPIRRGHVSGIRVHAACGQDGLNITILDASGREVADGEELVVVTNDFLFTGGDEVLTPVMHLPGFALQFEGELVRELIVDWMRQNGGRLSESRFMNENERRWNLPGPAPVSCLVAAP
jgi:5'-nucleotidase